MAKRQEIIGQHIITAAVLHMRQTQKQIQTEQEQLLYSIKLLQENKEFLDISFDNLAKLVQQILLNEVESVKALNKAIVTNKDAGCITHYGVRTHKLLEILEGTIALATEENVGRILEGRYAIGYHNAIPEVLPTLGQEGTFWGSSKPTFFTTLTETIGYILTGLRIYATDDSATLHTFHLPEKFDATLVVRSSLFINIDGSSTSLTIPHSGYSFGGDRVNDKVFRPQDCTSFLEMIVQLPANGASTADLYLTTRSLLKESLPVVDVSWFDTAGGQMVKLFDINTKTPNAGDVWSCRKFNEAAHIGSSLGCGGHAGIYLGQNGRDLVTLAYNRDMPGIEGFGIENRVGEDESKTQAQSFLTRNETGFTLGSEEAYPYKDLSDLVGLTAFVDKQIFQGARVQDEEEVEGLIYDSIKEFIEHSE